MKNIVLILSILILSILLVGTAYILKNKDICCKYQLCEQITGMCDEDEQEENGEEVLSEKGNKLVLENIKDGDTVDEGFEVKGSVSGEWFFEGVFPVRVLNQQGEIVKSFSATTQDDWLTEDLVKFSFKLDTQLEEESIVVLRFEKANPSGLEENDDTVDITVTIKPIKEIETMKVKVFFPSTKLNPEMIDCSLVYPVTRDIEKTVAVGRASLNELFKGTTEDEENDGYFSNINDGVEILSLSISKGVAYVDLSNELQEGVGGSCKVTSIRAQITETLKQFSTVDSVVISIEGESEDILQP